MIHGISEGVDVNKTSESKKCDICHYWHFLSKVFKFQSNVCNECHDFLLMSLSLSNIAVSDRSAGYCCIISRISKNEAIDLMRNVDLV